MADFSIFRLVAEYWGCGEMFAAGTSPDDVFQILKELSRGQPCDITGIRDYRMLDECGGIQWRRCSGRCPEGWTLLRTRDRSASRLFADGKFYHADGRAKFIFDKPRRNAGEAERHVSPISFSPVVEPLRNGTRKRALANQRVLRTLYPAEIYVEINPEDAARGEHRAESVGRRSSRSADQLKAKAFVTHTVRPGQVFIPMHYDANNR